MPTGHFAANIQCRFLLFLLAALTTFSGCGVVEIRRVTNYVYEPQYLSYEKLRQAGKVGPPRALVRPGKIYLKGRTLFLSDINRGIHVIDISRPSSPRFAAFLDLPGNLDMAALGNYLYADSYVDLMVFDIRNIDKIVPVKRIEESFPYDDRQCLYGLEKYEAILGGMMRPWRRERWRPRETHRFLRADRKNGVVVAWKESSTVKRHVDTDFSSCCFWSRRLYSVKRSEGGGSASAGVGGSMARFTVVGRCLYAVSRFDLHVFSLEKPESPVRKGEIRVGFNIETIFPHKGKLFLGSQQGMYIYDVRQEPERPRLISKIEHIRSYDPVVVSDPYAYVTLRRGDRGNLEIIDIRDIRMPKLAMRYNIREPFGLGIDGHTLFLCHGRYGLVLYDLKKTPVIEGLSINIPPAKAGIARVPDIHAFDVIPLEGLLIITGKTGLEFYDYSNPGKPLRLGGIPVRRTGIK